MAKNDPKAKRPTETHFQWRSRIIAMEQEARNRADSLVTSEAMRHGNYVDATITHVETNTRVQTKYNRRTSAMLHLYSTGQLDSAQYSATLEIARIAERIERAVSVRCASLEARVDNSRGASGNEREALTIVQLERAYSAWRQRIPTPKRMVLDMILSDMGLKATVRKYKMDLPRGKRLLCNALDIWNDEVAKARKAIDQRDVDWSITRLEAA